MYLVALGLMSRTTSSGNTAIGEASASAKAPVLFMERPSGVGLLSEVTGEASAL